MSKTALAKIAIEFDIVDYYMIFIDRYLSYSINLSWKNNVVMSQTSNYHVIINWKNTRKKLN